jgi:hypothetical protein
MSAAPQAFPFKYLYSLRLNAELSCIEDGVLVEHWDVIQDEATREQSKSGTPMFGDTFPTYR